jgi:hypothetical protein
MDKKKCGLGEDGARVGERAWARLEGVV